LSVEAVADYARQHRIDLIQSVQSCAFTADRDKLVQVLVNLLSNAIKFSAAGQRVTISAASSAAGPQFLVIDEGRGIPAEKQIRIFEKFEQVEETDRSVKGGTG